MKMIQFQCIPLEPFSQQTIQFQSVMEKRSRRTRSFNLKWNKFVANYR